MINTIFVFFILLILSITLLSISLTNYSIQNVYVNSKKCFYISEGGLELVYGKVVEEIQRAIKYGEHKLNNFLKFEYDNFIENEIDKELMGEDSIYLNVILNENGISYNLNKKNIEQKLNEEFQNGYKKFFLEKSKKYNFIKDIEKINGNGLKIDLVDDLVYIENNRIKFKISSLYKKRKIRKEITLDFYIKIPNKGNVDKNTNEFIEVRNWIRRR
ncbi:hypothetical protein [Tepidibacter thalassicus]|uniref:hypothetical protein n=1 Tax=Tepidibacter thalassicus TaxID=214905 RepID=UPI0015BC5FAC|nr:hypothetical protein [Tepidibacter thalassicus]